MKLLTRTTIRKKRGVLLDYTYLFHFKDPLLGRIVLVHWERK